MKWGQVYVCLLLHVSTSFLRRWTTIHPLAVLAEIQKLKQESNVDLTPFLFFSKTFFCV
jgi:hypothetical protein